MITWPIDLSPLRTLGCVLLPHDPGYAEACLPWNRAVAQQPAAVAMPRSAEEVAAVVRAAVGSGLRVAPQSTGHAAAALAPDALDRALLLRLDRLTGVSVDRTARTARILGGTLWRDVVGAASRHGLAALHGSAGDVSAAGFLLGGGLSFYGRAHGLASSLVRAVELVTADGELRRCSAGENRDLFWAVRGGGGSFGAVVAIEIDLLPLSSVYAGMLLWDVARAPEVLSAWASWTASVPESVTSSVRIMRFPPLPELPEFLRGRAVVVVDGAALGPDAEAAGLLEPLRALAPEVDTFGRIPAAGLIDVHMDPPAPTPVVTDHAVLATLPAEAVSALLAVAGPGVETPLMFAELRHCGGAMARPVDAALPCIPGEYVLFTAAIAASPAMAAEGLVATAEVVDALRPWSTGAAFANFNDRPADAARAFPADAWTRLRLVRTQVDPHRIWVAAHPV